MLRKKHILGEKGKNNYNLIIIKKKKKGEKKGNYLLSLITSMGRPSVIRKAKESI